MEVVKLKYKNLQHKSLCHFEIFTITAMSAFNLRTVCVVLCLALLVTEATCRRESSSSSSKRKKGNKNGSSTFASSSSSSSGTSKSPSSTPRGISFDRDSVTSSSGGSSSASSSATTTTSTSTSTKKPRKRSGSKTKSVGTVRTTSRGIGGGTVTTSTSTSTSSGRTSTSGSASTSIPATKSRKTGGRDSKPKSKKVAATYPSCSGSAKFRCCNKSSTIKTDDAHYCGCVGVGSSRSICMFEVMSESPLVVKDILGSNTGDVCQCD